MDRQMEQQRSIFLQEAFELLGELETALLELEEMPDNEELIDRVFRAMHTIKGSGAMFGFDAVAEFTHELETAYDLIRCGKMIVTKQLINLSLSARDLIAEMLTASESGNTVSPERIETILSALSGLIPDKASAESAMDSQSCIEDGPPQEAGNLMVTYRIRFRPPRDLFNNGTNPLLLLEELKGLGECRVVANMEAVPLLKELEPESCYIFWDILLTTDKGPDAIWDVFIFVMDTCEITVQVIEEEAGDDDESSKGYKRLGEILVERGDIAPGDITPILSGQKRIGEMLTDARLVTPDKVESALVEQEHIKKIRHKRMADTHSKSVRVDAEKLDILVDLVGELVTVQARLSRRAASDREGEITSIAEEVERLVGELRDNTMSIRMRPIGTIFSRFKRLVRDLSDTLGKQVVLTTEGGETELDKTVIEQLNDPLVHIIRNAVDHGIESPEKRKEVGKSAHGTIRLSAAHIGANVIIRITDDGAGLNTESILASAEEKGIVPPDANLTETEIFELIFAPGFSTARAVTGVSGRGVGMDVVKKSIEGLRGSLDVSSQKGDGTVITLVLPLTLAIIEGFMVTLGEGQYVLPLAAVEECVEVSGMEMEGVRRRNMLNIRGAVVPYLSLREVFCIDGNPPATERIVVIKSGRDRVGFGVDGVIGHHQTVIKSLGKMYRDIKGISGATILGDGTVALILDVVQLVELAEKRKQAA